MWVEGGKQKALEESLGVGGFGYPALVALKPADLKYSTMRRYVAVLDLVKRMGWGWFGPGVVYGRFPRTAIEQVVCRWQQVDRLCVGWLFALY